MARGAVDERGFEAVRRIRKSHGDMPLAEFKALVREQFNMLLIDTEAALAAIPAMLPSDVETRRKAFELIKTALSARGEIDRRRTSSGWPKSRGCSASMPRATATRHTLSADQKEPQARAS